MSKTKLVLYLYVPKLRENQTLAGSWGSRPPARLASSGAAQAAGQRDCKMEMYPPSSISRLRDAHPSAILMEMPKPHLCVKVVQAQGVLGKDLNVFQGDATSDCYVVATLSRDGKVLADGVQQTVVVSRTTDPVWNISLRFTTIRTREQLKGLRLTVSVYDEDKRRLREVAAGKFLKQGTPLGEILLDLDHLATDSTQIKKAKAPLGAAPGMSSSLKKAVDKRKSGFGTIDFVVEWRNPEWEEQQAKDRDEMMKKKHEVESELAEMKELVSRMQEEKQKLEEQQDHARREQP